ncbi:DUF3726 domain-containing protein [Amorphus coralli]|uniref:DUF3726 domain-containing protein n=1 Tax=Amorphus coralli TaxID=340680 RepID=UPI000372D688|nr:DUF3726 domain-containing protein [Amorphus coralli]
MTTLSFNEIEVSVRKAGIGAGLPYGIANEVGRAAEWLAIAGLPALATCGSALEASLEGRTALGRGTDTGAGWTLAPPAGIPLCACHAGVVAADLLNAGSTTVRLTSVASPVLVVALLATISEAPAVSVLLGDTHEGAPSVLVTAPTVSLLSGIELLDWTGPADLLIELGSVAPRPAPLRVYADRTARDTAFADGAPVEPEAAEVIARLMARTLVPASEESRQRGAGAGRIDSD